MNLSLRSSHSTFNVLTLVIFAIFSLCTFVHAQTNRDAKNENQTTGSASILSHFVYHGLSQTNKDPSLQTSLFMNIGPQFRIGLWGSNVSYEGQDNHIVIKIPLELKLEFNKDASLTIGYSSNQYYKSRIRNGNTSSLHLDIFDYLIIYEIESNWEGSETKSKYFAFNKTFKVGNDFTWENQIGYTVLSVENLQNYFDLSTGIAGKNDRITYKFIVTATSNPSQFNGAGDVFAILSVGFDF